LGDAERLHQRLAAVAHALRDTREVALFPQHLIRVGGRRHHVMLLMRRVAELAQNLSRTPRNLYDRDAEPLDRNARPNVHPSHTPQLLWASASPRSVL